MLFRSAYPDVVVPDQTLPDFLFATLSGDDAARTAVIDTATGRELTYRELVDVAGRVAGAVRPSRWTRTLRTGRAAG